MSEIYIEKNILEALRDLPVDKKKEAADFIEFLRSKHVQSSQRRVKGLWNDFHIEVNPADLTQIRHEMWSSFPRELE